MVIALTYRQAGHPALSKFAARCLELLQMGMDANLRLFAGAFLELYGSMCGRLDVSLMTYRIIRPLLDHPDVTSLAKCMSLGISSWTCVHTENFEEGRQIIARLETFGHEENLHLGRRFACILGAYLDFRRADLKAAQERIRRFEQILIPSAPYEAASIVGMKCYMALFAGHPEQAAAMGSELMRLYDRTGSLCHRLFMYAVVIWANAALDRFKEAESVIREYRKIEPGRHMEWMSWGPLVSEAWMAMQRQQTQQLEDFLRKIFEQSRPRNLGYGFAMIWSKAWMPELCERALEAGIEIDNVRDYIREYRVEAPGQHMEAWPWQIRIRCLGQFDILAADRQVDYGTKPPRKLLALLKAIIALGSRDVPEQKLADALWSEEDGDTAHQSFTAALHRLRKLLGDKTLIRQRDNRISLDTSRVWVDVLAFEALCAREAEADHATTKHVIDLYRGEFLVHDDAPWAFSMREKLRARTHAGGARRLSPDARAT